MASITHAKIGTLPDWTQADVDVQIALGNLPAGTTPADLQLTSDWNDEHVFDTTGLVTGAAGSDTQVQFNDGGAFGGDAGFTYIKATQVLELKGTHGLNIEGETTDGRVTIGAANSNGANAGNGALVIGSRNTNANGGDSAVLVGNDNINGSGSDNNIIGGNGNQVAGSTQNCVVWGYNNTLNDATENGSTVIGTQNTVDAYRAGAFGYANSISGGSNQYAFGAGLNNTVTDTMDFGLSDARKITLDSSGNLLLRGTNITASTVAGLDASSKLQSLSTATYPSLTELSYVKGVTSAIQTQLNGKQASGTYVTDATNSTLTLTGTTLGLNLGNANTWTGQQTFNTAAAVFGVGTITPKIYPAANGTNAVGIYKADGTTQIMYVDTTNSRIGIGAAPTAYNFEVFSASNIAMKIWTTGGSFGYTIGRNTGTGFLDILGNQGGFSGINVDAIKSAGAITIGGNAVISNWAASLGIGNGSGTPISTIDIRSSSNTVPNLSMGGGATSNYNFRRNTATGYLEIAGVQAQYTGYLFSTGNYTNVFTMIDGVGAVFNETGESVLDFRVESDANTHSIFVDASANAVGFNHSAPTALVHIGAGAAGVGKAPLKLTSGTNLTTAEAGAFEYNGTNLFFTRAGTTRENVLVGVDNAAAPATNVGVAIVNYYGSSATNFLGTPNRWVSVDILGTIYKIPLYN